MSGADPSQNHPEPITLGLHEPAPPELMESMANDVELDLGWGRLIFGQTFADSAALADVLRQEAPGGATSASTHESPTSSSPKRRMSCSSTPATPIGCVSPTTRKTRIRRPLRRA
ncbi:GNAT-family acetyltransferase TIGR03103 domain protein [Mycobacterium kansasii]|uniref:GNAT-family acetyltransferase TIGR03103 domain protein n=1 Tax=Mycobacterium kansasii TaxID=1768 RepID=A0A1V3XSL8_MYCKA|nr:GNAT-family acetyltransferase TIGR03103 domain protein [Mycobacterium kansasii]